MSDTSAWRISSTPGMHVRRLRDAYFRRLQTTTPATVRFCDRCVLSNQRPRLWIDPQGVCSACHVARAKAETDWSAREEELLQLLDRYRSSDGQPDVIVPFSGGKDSAMVAYRLATEYDMHPLLATFSPLLYTEHGKANWTRACEAIPCTDIALFVPSAVHYQTLARLGFFVLGDPFLPFIYGVKAFPLRLALERGIPLIMYAEDGEAEYGGGLHEGRPGHTTAVLVSDYFSGFPPDIWQRVGLSASALAPFTPPVESHVRAAGIHCAFFGYYHRWVPQENYYYAVRHTGFRPNPERSEGTYSRYASLDDKLDGLHYYLGYIKFGLGRATSDAAHEIRDGHITREEAVSLVHQYDGQFPTRYFPECLDFLGLTESAFWDIVDGFRPAHLWHHDKVMGGWHLKYEV